MRLKKEAVKRFGIHLEGHGWVYLPHYKVAKKAASALIRSSDKIPVDRQQVLKDTVMTFWKEYGNEVKEKNGVDKAKEDDWESILQTCYVLEDHFRGPEFIEHGNSVIKQLTKTCVYDKEDRETWPDLESYIKEWRQHFLDHVKPQFLSDKWTVDGEIYTNSPK
jgi:hypothetical protein